MGIFEEERKSKEKTKTDSRHVYKRVSVYEIVIKIVQKWHDLDWCRQKPVHSGLKNYHRQKLSFRDTLGFSGCSFQDGEKRQRRLNRFLTKSTTMFHKLGDYDELEKLLVS